MYKAYNKNLKKEKERINKKLKNSKSCRGGKRDAGMSKHKVIIQIGTIDLGVSIHCDKKNVAEMDYHIDYSNAFP